MTEPSSPNPVSTIVKVDSANGCGICTRESTKFSIFPEITDTSKSYHVISAQGIVQLERYTRQGGSEMSQQNNNDTTCNEDSVQDSITSRAIESRVTDFYKAMSNFGYTDVEAAVSKFAEVGLSPDDLSEQVKEFSKETDTEIDNIDICAIAWEHVLQQARNKISETLKFDISNDKCEFYVAGDYHATTFDADDESDELLKDEIREANDEQIEKLKDDVFVKVFFEDNDIDIKKIRETKSENNEETT